MGQFSANLSVRLPSTVGWALLLGAAHWAGVTSPALGAPQAADTKTATNSSLGYEGVDPGTARGFDLEGGRIIDPLPFDVQFFLQSPVAENVDSVSGRYIQYRKQLPEGQGCNDRFSNPARPPRGYLAPLVMVTNNDVQVAMAAPFADPLDEGAEAARRQALGIPARDLAGVPGHRKIAFTRFIKADASATPPTVRTVELSVPEVAPNRAICFEFNLVKKVKLDTFRAAAREAVDLELQDKRWVSEEADPASPGDIVRTTVDRPQAYNLLRRRLMQRILEERQPGERLTAPRGSFFDPNVNLAGVKDSHLGRFTSILAGQTDRFDQIAAIEGTSSHDGSRDELIGALLELVRSETYGKLATSTLARELLGDRIRILQLADDDDTSGEKIVEAAEGRDAGSDRLDLETVWGPVLLDKPLGNLEQTRRDLLKLERIVKRWFQDRPSLAQTEGLDADALEAFLALLEQALIPLEFQISDLTELRLKLVERKLTIASLVNLLAIELESTVRILATSVGSYETRASFYISADVGVGVAPDVEQTFTYFGTNIYLRPVNKKAPIRGFSFRKRFSFIVGLTAEKLEQDGQLKGIVGSSPLLVGGGFRLNEFLRVSAGGLIFKDEDPNPLLTDETLAWSPYVSLSIDWNLRKIFSRFGGALNLADPPPP